MILLAAHEHDVSGFGVVEWMLVSLAGLFVAWVIWKTVALTIRPGEDDPNHIKRMILEDDPPAAGQDGESAARGSGGAGE